MVRPIFYVFMDIGEAQILYRPSELAIALAPLLKKPIMTDFSQIIYPQSLYVL